MKQKKKKKKTQSRKRSLRPTRFVQRDETGKITGHFANPQPGYAEEELPEDHPHIKAYHAERQRQEDEGRRTSSIPALLARIDEIERRLTNVEKRK